MATAAPTRRPGSRRNRRASQVEPRPTSIPTGRAWEQRASRARGAASPSTPALKGTLAQGPDRLLAAMQLNDRLGQLAYKVYFYPSLKYDEDQRDNQVNARKQQVQALMARWQQATSWFSPELLDDSARDGPQLDRRQRRTWRCTDSPSRRSTGSRSTCSTSRASSCCRCRRGCRAPRTRHTRRSRSPTRSSRRSRSARAKT